MAGSNAFRKPAASPALSEPAASAIRSSTSRAGSAARQQTANGSSSATRRVMSGPVAGVDPDVAFRKVAGPEARFAFSLPSDGQPDFAIRGVQFHLQFLLGERRRQAALAYRYALHVDVGLRRIEGDPRIPGGGEYAAPVRVGTRDRRLHQRRVGDAARHPRRAFTVPRAGDHDGDELPGSFAIARNLLRQAF